MSDMPGSKEHFFHSKAQKARVLKAKALDEIRFFRSWIESPLKVGAVSPSGPLLAAKMAGYLDNPTLSRVVELGPGTGVVTKAILARGVPQQNLAVIEYSDSFCRLLDKRYPAMSVMCGDAYAIDDVLAANGWSVDGNDRLDGIVSSLPLFTRPEEERQELVKRSLALLKPGAPFIQFSYALVPPVKPVPGQFSLEVSGWVWKNLPPARVFVYRSVH